MKSMSCRVSGTIVGAGGFRALFLLSNGSSPSWSRRGKACVAGNAAPVGFDHQGIGENHRDRVFGLADGDCRPVFVSPELGEREPIRHLHSVLVLRGNGPAAQDGEHDCNDGACSGGRGQNARAVGNAGVLSVIISPGENSLVRWSRADQPNVKAKASTPEPRNSISNWRSAMGWGCRIS